MSGCPILVDTQHNANKSSQGCIDELGNCHVRSCTVDRCYQLRRSRSQGVPRTGHECQAGLGDALRTSSQVSRHSYFDILVRDLCLAQPLGAGVEACIRQTPTLLFGTQRWVVLVLREVSDRRRHASVCCAGPNISECIEVVAGYNRNLWNVWTTGMVRHVIPVNVDVQFVCLCKCTTIHHPASCAQRSCSRARMAQCGTVDACTFTSCLCLQELRQRDTLPLPRFRKTRSVHTLVPISSQYLLLSLN